MMEPHETTDNHGIGWVTFPAGDTRRWIVRVEEENGARWAAFEIEEDAHQLIAESRQAGRRVEFYTFERARPGYMLPGTTIAFKGEVLVELPIDRPKVPPRASSRDGRKGRGSR